MSETRYRPTYVIDGFVVTHPWADFGYYMNQFEVLRRASIIERLTWWLLKRAPTESTK